jgi:hypothetical protein
MRFYRQAWTDVLACAVAVIGIQSVDRLRREANPQVSHQYAANMITVKYHKAGNR